MQEEKSVQEKELEKKIKQLFICRVCMWVLAAAACIYWIVLSFWLYEQGIHEVHEYATYLRPRLYTALIVSFVCICISFALRRKSDGYKKQLKDDREKRFGTF